MRTPSSRRKATNSARATGPVWPASELDGSWDAGLAAWRYRRVLAAIREREAQCTTHPHRPRRAEWDVVIDVPVPAGWRAYDSPSSIALYGCVGRLLSGHVERRPNGEGTVLAAFPLLPLRRAVWPLLRAAQRRRRLERTPPLDAAA